jgi:uncharacterized protein (TIGR02145 family)
MKNLRLGDWIIPEASGGLPPTGTSYVRSILGADYTTVIVPDGKEWMTTNLAWIGAGRWRMDAAENDGCGRYYTTEDVDAIKDLLPSAWRIPTYADSFALASLYRNEKAKDLAGPSNAWGYGGIATNESGLNLIPTGMRNTFYTPPIWKFLGLPYDEYASACFYQELQTPPAGTGYSTAQANQGTGGVFSFGPGNRYPENPLNSFPIRLVRDAEPIPPIPALNSYHDILVLPSGQVETTESLAQRVDVRLRTFIGEHWLNPELGVPWFEEFLRKSPDLAVCRQILVTVLQDVPGVEEVHSLTVDFAKSSSQMRVSFVVSGSDSIPQSGLTAVPL